jgi:hypothetical protein
MNTNIFTLVKVLSASRWKKAEEAFYKNVEITAVGSINNLRGGILAAMQQLLK